MTEYFIHFENGSNGYLAHYGVKGMKWGIRRYQNYDRTLTKAGKEQSRNYRKQRQAMRSTKAANDIVRSLTKKERDLLGAERNKDWIDPETEKEQSKNIAKRVVVSDPKTKEPVSFLEIWDNGGSVGQIAIATKHGDKYRGKGYASEAVKKGVDWFEKYGHKNLDYMEWIAEKGNEGSVSLAKKNGFKRDTFANTHPEWDDYPDYVIYTYRKNGKERVDKLLSNS